MSAPISEPRFVTPLRVERLINGSWRLVRPLIFESAKLDIQVLVPRGFVTDFASVPRLPFAYLLFAGVGDEAAVVHDFLYSTACTTRAAADEIFAEACAVLGVPAWRRGPMWAAVRLFGGSRYTKLVPKV